MHRLLITNPGFLLVVVLDVCVASGTTRISSRLFLDGGGMVGCACVGANFSAVIFARFSGHTPDSLNALIWSECATI